MREASQTFDADASSVRSARRFLRDCLHRWSADGYGMSGEQVLSELATNAALHAHSEYTVHLRLDPDALLVEVSDSSTVLPQPRDYSAQATTGRGLTLVSALTDAWGVQSSPTGKTVWCLITEAGEQLPHYDQWWSGSEAGTAPAARPAPPARGDVKLEAA